MSKKLVIAEKPSAAKDFAEILNCNNRKDGYIEGENYIVTWCLGHLFTLLEPGDYKDSWEDWKFEDLPVVPEEFQIKPTKRGKEQFNIIKKLINREDVETIINGGDAGREGELIQRYVLNYAETNKPVKRLWVNSLTEEAIEKGFNNLKDQSEYDNLYLSAKTRAELDWLLGINYTRAYTTKNQGNNTIVVGRVQTAILNLIAKRDKKREEFEPKTYNQIVADFDNYQGKYINKESNLKVFNSSKAKKIKSDCKDKTGEVTKVDKKAKKKKAPKLFNLTGLQKRMNKKHGFSAQKTLTIVQNLYEEHKILSYPRTDSKYLGETHKKEIPSILQNISFSNFKEHIENLDLDNLSFSKRFINDDKITDHHAIIPTDNKEISSIYKKISADKKKVFDEVCKRLIAQFLNPYKYSTTQVITSVEDYQFRSKGKVILTQGWKKLYSNKDNNKSLPDLEEGDNYKVTEVELKEKKTKPPKQFTENKLLTKLEKYNIGTEATRAGIIEKLLNRKYLKREGKKIVSTNSGKNIINTIITDKLKSPEMTGKLEDKLAAIKQGKISPDQVLNKEIENLKAEIKKLKNKSISIDKEKKETVCSCPKCKDGGLVKRKGFYGCNNYPECEFTIGKIKDKLLTKNQIKRLCENGKTGKMRGFKSSKGNKFSAKLKLTDDCKIEFVFEDRELGECPKCGSGIIESKGKFYGCSEYPDCEFTLSKKIAGKKLTTNQVKKLINDGKTKKLQGFRGEKGKFSAKLKLTDEHEVDFAFEENKSKELDINCPVCSNLLKERNWGYGCSNYPDCEFSISKEIASKKITKDILKNICQNGKSKELKFKNKEGKEFRAKLVLEDKTVEMKF